MEEVKLKRPWYKRRLFAALVIVIVLAAIAGLIWFRLEQGKPHLPASIKGGVHFTYFLPDKLPVDYAVQPSSYSYEQGVLIYRVTGPQHVTILVSQQPEPTNFDVGHFQSIFKNKLGVETPYGKAYVGTSENTRVGSLDTAGSWLLMSAPPATNPQIFETILNHLYKLN
jgi:hypothetical protein